MFHVRSTRVCRIAEWGGVLQREPRCRGDCYRDSSCRGGVLQRERSCRCGVLQRERSFRGGVLQREPSCRSGVIQREPRCRDGVLQREPSNDDHRHLPPVCARALALAPLPPRRLPPGGYPRWLKGDVVLLKPADRLGLVFKAHGLWGLHLRLIDVGSRMQGS